MQAAESNENTDSLSPYMPVFSEQDSFWYGAAKVIEEILLNTDRNIHFRKAGSSDEVNSQAVEVRM